MGKATPPGGLPPYPAQLGTGYRQPNELTDVKSSSVVCRTAQGICVDVQLPPLCPEFFIPCTLLQAGAWHD